MPKKNQPGTIPGLASQPTTWALQPTPPTEGASYIRSPKNVAGASAEGVEP